MLIVNIDGNSYHIAFQRLWDGDGPFGTQCFIDRYDPETDQWTTEAVGESLCHPSDNFNKSVGRKIALTRALEGFGRDTRRMFWKVYLRECKV